MGWKGYQLEKGGISIITDKTEYEAGSNLKVKIKNNFGEQICFSSCYPYLLESKNEKWESYKYIECQKFNGNGHCIKAGDLKAFELTLPQVPEGLHRLAIPVCFDCKSEESFKEEQKFYSNEFWIREKKIEGVTIVTDKIGYEIRETVRITARNNLDRSIWDFEVCGGQPWWGLQKFEKDQWKVLNFSLPNLVEEEIEGQRMYIEVCDLILCERPEHIELKPNSEINYNWQLGSICEWPLQPVGIPKTEPKIIENGTYRVFVIYGFSKDFTFAEAETIYSNEFTIK